MTSLSERTPICDIMSPIRRSGMFFAATVYRPRRSANVRPLGRNSFGPTSSFAATDFFTVQVLTLRRLVTYYVLFFIHLENRLVNIVGITAHPNQRWLQQMPDNVNMDVASCVIVVTFYMITTPSTLLLSERSSNEPRFRPCASCDTNAARRQNSIDNSYFRTFNRFSRPFVTRTQESATNGACLPLPRVWASFPGIPERQQIQPSDRNS
jgi:hypothetical protein